MHNHMLNEKGTGLNASAKSMDPGQTAQADLGRYILLVVNFGTSKDNDTSCFSGFSKTDCRIRRAKACMPSRSN